MKNHIIYRVMLSKKKKIVLEKNFQDGTWYKMKYKITENMTT